MCKSNSLGRLVSSPISDHIHGEPKASKVLATHIKTSLGWKCLAPEYLDEENLL